MVGFFLEENGLECDDCNIRKRGGEHCGPRMWTCSLNYNPTRKRGSLAPSLTLCEAELSRPEWGKTS